TGNRSDTPADHPVFTIQNISQVVVEDNTQPFRNDPDAAVAFEGSCGVVRDNAFPGAKAEASGVQACPGGIQSPAEPQPPRFPAAFTVQRPAEEKAGKAPSKQEKQGNQGKQPTGSSAKPGSKTKTSLPPAPTQAAAPSKERSHRVLPIVVAAALGIVLGAGVAAFGTRSRRPGRGGAGAR